MRSLLRFVVGATLLGGTLTVLFLCSVYFAASQVPDFYHEALVSAPVDQHAAGDELEQHVLQLHNKVRQEGHWQAVFTDQQINGWLAADLPEKFPKLLPDGAHDPRVAIESQRLLLACQYDRAKVSSVVSLDLDVHLTDETNVVAVHIRSARAGVLPVPQKNLLDRIESAARDADLTLRWAQIGGDPVALLTVPTEHEDYDRRLIQLELIELRDGELFVAGRTENIREEAMAANLPQEAVGQSTESQTRQR